MYDDGAGAAQEATRDYVLRLDGKEGEPKLLNIFGGKITTYRRLAEAALSEIDKVLGRTTEPWTAGAHLPGGDFPADGFEKELASLARAHAFLDDAAARRLVRSYGTTARDVLAGADSMEDLGEYFGAGLTEREVDHLCANEWAETADDILWRRTKLGLHLTAAERRRLEKWINQRAVTQ